VSETWTRAIAYLKPNLTNDESEATVSLKHEDSPVLRDLHNGLLVAYLVDEGTRFDYLQNRHLVAAGIDEERLHKTAVGNLYSLAERHLRPCRTSRLRSMSRKSLSPPCLHVNCSHSETHRRLQLSRNFVPLSTGWRRAAPTTRYPRPCIVESATSGYQSQCLNNAVRGEVESIENQMPPRLTSHNAR